MLGQVQVKFEQAIDVDSINIAYRPNQSMKDPESNFQVAQ